ncbi:MAG TPA: methyltransferase domain-containing protein [Protaetiibacter sp.]|nr:methyltransferase domain-containing protein [Protaetiibacter sp.]
MSGGLHVRETQLLELMDDPDCDLQRLENTYRLFGPVNRVVSGWRGLYRDRIRPLLAMSRTDDTGPDARRPFRLLDLGSGGGDIARSLAGWARHDGLPLEVTAADPDERAHAFASAVPHPGVEVRRAWASELVAAGERFDLVVSNHVLHHLDDVPGFLDESERLAPRALHSDIRRSSLAFALYSAATWPWARRSFIFSDGRLSIRRSYTAEELQALAPTGWRAEAVRPFRVVLSRGMPTPAEGGRG